MKDPDIQKQDKLKLLQLLSEIRRMGLETDEPIKTRYLNLSPDVGAQKHEVLIPLSEIDNAQHLKYLNPKHKVLVPLLLKYLYEFKSRNFKEFIIDALKVKGFTNATETLIIEFNRTNFGDSYKWSIGDALSVIQDGKYEDEYINIIKEKKHGTARQMVTITLGKLKSEKAIPILISLLDDEDVNGHVLVALGYYKKPMLIKYIEPFLTHKKKWIRNEAKSALKKIERAS